MIKFLDESGSLDYTVPVYCTCELYNIPFPFFMLKRYVCLFGKKRHVAHKVHQLLFTTRFFVLTKLSMPNGSYMDTHRIYDLTYVHLFKCIFNLGPRAINMLQSPRCLNLGCQTPFGKKSETMSKKPKPGEKSQIVKYHEI